MKVEETGRRTNCLSPGPILMAVFRMLSDGRVATRLLATRHLLHVVVGLIGRRAIATAAALATPIRRGRAMTRMGRIGGLRGNRGCGRNRDCGDKHFHCSFSRRLFGFKLLETGVEVGSSRWVRFPRGGEKVVMRRSAEDGSHRPAFAALRAEPPRRRLHNRSCRPMACRGPIVCRGMSRARLHNGPCPAFQPWRCASWPVRSTWPMA